MKHTDIAIQLVVERLLEKAVKNATPKKLAGNLFEAAEIIQQLMKERDEARKQATSPRYLITMEYGEYDDFISLPVMIVPDSITADLIIHDLRDFPNSRYRRIVEEVCDMQIPEDAGFSRKQLPYHSLETVEVF